MLLMAGACYRSDIFCPRGTQQQTRRTLLLLLSIDGTDKLADGRRTSDCFIDSAPGSVTKVTKVGLSERMKKHVLAPLR